MNIDYDCDSEVSTKSIEAEAVFTKREMNNERNVNFFQNTMCIKKVWRLKTYLQEEI